VVVRCRVGEGIFGQSVFGGRGVQWEPEATYDVCCVLKVSSLGGSFPTVRATAVRQDTVLAGDPKVSRLLCNTNLNMNIPSRGSEEERIRILLRVWANIQSRGYNK